MNEKDKAELKLLKDECAKCKAGPGSNCSHCPNFWRIAKLEGREAV